MGKQAGVLACDLSLWPLIAPSWTQAIGQGKLMLLSFRKRYFVCPTKCGVFVAITKLSTPTIGSGARPPSAASSRSGRITPSASWSFGSGRVTPSHSVGRITPYVDKKAVLPMSGGVTPKMKQATVPGKLPIQLQSGKLPPSPRSQPLFASLSPDCDPFTRGHLSPTVQLSPSSCSLGQNLEQMTDWPLAHNISVAGKLGPCFVV